MDNVFLDLNPRPWRDAPVWGAIIALSDDLGISGWRTGYAVSDTGGIQSKSVKELCFRATGRRILYQHDYNRKLTKEQNQDARKKVSIILADNHGDVIELGPNEPPELSGQINDPAWDSKVATLMEGVADPVFGVAHGYLHDFPEVFDWPRELERTKGRYAENRKRHPGRRLMGNLYTDIRSTVHPVEQARLKCLWAPYDGICETNCYFPQGFDEFERGLIIGMQAGEILRYQPFVTIYASHDNDVDGDVYKDFGLLKDDLSPKVARIAGFKSGLGI